MNNTTLKACVTKALKREYPDYKVYKDKQGSEVILPAFFVRYIDVGQRSAGMDFYSQSYMVEIRHRQEDDFPENELETYLDLTGGQVVDLLSTVSDGEFFARAENIDYRISDGVLCVVATYRIRKMITQEQDPYMKILQNNEEVK
ncbi:hypothetical protein EOM57_01105 [Candidatus Saccharibacteria bacterium]|nr:hypothetical protein [Candidatus Saccharibacteria bacterium]